MITDSSIAINVRRGGLLRRRQILEIEGGVIALKALSDVLAEAARSGHCSCEVGSKLSPGTIEVRRVKPEAADG